MNVRRSFARVAIAATAVVLLPFAHAAPASAQMTAPAAGMTQLAGGDRIVLVLLPAEPFYTADDVRAGHVTDGMLIVGGATPVPPDAPSHPNHHLVVHVYDAASGAALRGADVTMAVTAAGVAMSVPVVEMQAVGKGPASTHYGNNVTLAPGAYTVTVTVNHTATATFAISVSAGTGGR